MIKAEREKQEQHLPNILKGFGTVSCGVRNDNLNDLAHTLVRDKSIENFDKLQEMLDEITKNKIRGYIEWQYFNQATNDLIEHYINDNENVIPTLRKIKYVDFIMKIGEKYIPFDLKITHISDDYFDMLSKGLDEDTNVHDEYIVGDSESESQVIKAVYSSLKSEHSLPNYGGLKKFEIIENMKEKLPKALFNQHFQNFVQNREALIGQTNNEIKKLEWWNYKFQGERLFKNNNRFFVFLVFIDSFEDARPLKREYNSIGKQITEKLNNVAQGSIHEVAYTYEKDASVNGNYRINTFSVLVSGNK